MDEIKGNVRTHPGTRYGGSAQRTASPEDVYTNEENFESQKPPLNIEPVSSVKPSGVRFVSAPGRLTVIDGKKQPLPDVPKRVFLADNVDQIQWVGFNTPHYYHLKCRKACDFIKRKRLALDMSISPSLYQDFVHRLNLLISRRRVAGPTLLRLVATGEVPGEKEFGCFDKFIVLEETFMLPHLFFHDCSAAIVIPRGSPRP